MRVLHFILTFSPTFSLLHLWPNKPVCSHARAHWEPSFCPGFVMMFALTPAHPRGACVPHRAARLRTCPRLNALPWPCQSPWLPCSFSPRLPPAKTSSCQCCVRLGEGQTCLRWWLLQRVGLSPPRSTGRLRGASACSLHVGWCKTPCPTMKVK